MSVQVKRIKQVKLSFKFRIKIYQLVNGGTEPQSKK